MEIQAKLTEYRWTYQDLFRAYLHSDGSAGFSNLSQYKRFERLATILFEDLDMLKLLLSSGSGSRDEVGGLLFEFVSERLASELDALRQKSSLFKKYTGPASIDGINLSSAYQEIEKYSPTLNKVLLQLLENRRKDYQRKATLDEGPITAIATILSYRRASKSSNYIPKLLGLYCHGLGTKRRVIEVFAGLGLMPSYKTILQDIKGISLETKECITYFIEGK